MASKSTQTDPRQAVYRLNFQLRVPGEPTGNPAGEGELWARRPIWLPAGFEATSGQLAGLQIPALKHAGAVVQIKEAEVPCEFCQAHGTAAQKKERYGSAVDLAEHYKDAHPGVRSVEAF